MPVAAINAEVPLTFGVGSRLAITPGVGGSVDFRCADANGMGTVTGRRIYTAQTIDIPGGSTVYLRAIGSDATYEDGATNTALSAPPATFSFSTPANEAVLRLAAYRLHIANLAAKNGTAPPELATPFTAVGTPYCIDPTNAAGGRDGSFAKPYNSLDELLSSGTLDAATRGNILFKAGGSMTTTAFYEFSHSGTAYGAASATAAFVFGIYDPLTGSRMMNPPPGSFTITCAAASNNFFIRLNNSGALSNLYIAFDGLAIVGANASGGQGAIHVGGGTGGMVQVTNCVMASAGQPCISSAGRNMTIQGNSLSTASGAPTILIRGDTGGDTASVMSDNHISVGGIFHDAQGNYPFKGTIAHNTFADCIVAGSQLAVLLLGGGATSARIYGNNMLRCGMSIELYSGGTSSGNIDSLLIEGNTATDCKFPCQISRCYGKFIVQYNFFLRAGSNDNGVTAADSGTNFSRCFELYSPDSSIRAGGGVVRYNLAGNAFCFIADGSEGVGFGLDNNTCDTFVYGNIATGNEGQGIQCNRNGRGNRIFGNLVYDNNTCTRAGVTFGAYQDGEIAVVVSPYTLVYNNTCVSVGRKNQRHSVFVGGTVSEFNDGVQVRNNVLIGASLSALKIDTRGTTAATESHNSVFGSPVLRRDNAGAAATAGTGTEFASARDFDLTDPLVPPTLAGSIDGTGTTAIAGSVSGSGLPLRQRTPRGWLHASF